MRRPYIGLTGFTAEDEISVVLNCINSFPGGFGPYQFMNGVLVNQDTINGLPCLKFPKRYAEPARTARLFPQSENVLNLYHYTTSSSQFSFELEKLIKFGGRNLNGFQLNLTWPDPKEIEKFRRDGNTHVIVQQIGSKAFDEIDNNPKKLVKRLKNYFGLVEYILLDPSGGRRIPLDVGVMVEYLRELYDRGVNEKLMIGFAGGISPYNQETLVVPLISEFEGLSMDLEGSIRDRDTDEFLFTEAAKAIGAFHKHVVKRTIESIPSDEESNNTTEEVDEDFQAWLDAGMPRDWFFS